MAIRALLILGFMALGSWQLVMLVAGPDRLKNLEIEDSCILYINYTLPRLIEDWRYEDFVRHTTVDYKREHNLGIVRQQFAGYKQYLGRFHRLSEPSGRVAIENIRGVLTPTGYYTVRADYRFMTADIRMKLVFRAGGWKYRNFTVRPDAYIPVPE